MSDVEAEVEEHETSSLERMATDVEAMIARASELLSSPSAPRMTREAVEARLRLLVTVGRIFQVATPLTRSQLSERLSAQWEALKTAEKPMVDEAEAAAGADGPGGKRTRKE